MNKVEGNTLPCGYVMGVHGALASGIPGLKSETWGTLRVFPLALVGKKNSDTDLSPYPSSTDASPTPRLPHGSSGSCGIPAFRAQQATTFSKGSPRRPLFTCTPSL